MPWLQAKKQVPGRCFKCWIQGWANAVMGQLPKVALPNGRLAFVVRAADKSNAGKEKYAA